MVDKTVKWWGIQDWKINKSVDLHLQFEVPLAESMDLDNIGMP